MQLVLDGKDTDEIAERIGISVHGVKYHLKKVMERLKKKNRYLAAMDAEDKGLL